MKLATIKNKTRDGQLIIVSRDLKTYVVVDKYPTLQSALDHWDVAKPLLEKQYNDLLKNLSVGLPFDASKVEAPLPRTYQWLDGSTFVTHVQLVRKSRGVEMPENFWTDPLMYQGAGDHMMGANDPIVAISEDDGIDFEAEIAIITNDVPMGVSEQEAHKHIQLIVLLNDVSLRTIAVEEMKKGFGFIQAKPATAFSPVAITPSELGEAWKDAKVHLPLRTSWNGVSFGHPNAGVDMTFSFARLVAHAARTRFLKAGTIIGSGTVSNQNNHEVGSSCIIEKRAREQIEEGKISTPYMRFGDRVCIEMLDDKGISIFGKIDQTVVKYKPST